MRRLVELLKCAKNSWMKDILEQFKPLLKLLALDEEFYSVKEKEFSQILSNETRFLIHPFHKWLPNLLRNVIILDSQAVYDTMRNLFLQGFALKSPDCLNDCRNNYACCHGNYAINPIDYQRIIANNLLDPSLFSCLRNKYKLKLAIDKNQRKYCCALDVSTKKCLIHQYKPPTCCKYPLISNIQTWSEELTAWTGMCAHSDVVWATRVHPAVLKKCRDLWVDSHLLWESEQNVFYRIKEPISSEIRELLSRILSIKQSSWPYKKTIIKRVLLENYSEPSIQKALTLLKK